MKPEIYKYQINGERFIVLDSPNFKSVRSAAYNYDFDKESGFFARWGRTKEDDPKFSPIGPEIADIEISIHGCPDQCDFCYKSNTRQAATNMTLDTFQSIIEKMPKSLTQVALGITGIRTNPDLIPILSYCRDVGIIPNFTLSGIDLQQDMAEECMKYIGAIAVSAYQKNKGVCYRAIQRFADLGLKQANMHLMVSMENLPFVYEVLEDCATDPRLENMNAVVLLAAKPKGRAGIGYSTVPVEEYIKILEFCFERGIRFGFDSCTAPKFELAVKQMKFDKKKETRLLQSSESCESSIFSSYINVHGEYFHCSFGEGEAGQHPVNVVEAEDFLKDVWYDDIVNKLRKETLCTEKNGCRECILFPSINPNPDRTQIRLPVIQGERYEN